MALLALTGVGLLLRLFRITQSYDVFIDEVTYTTIAHNLAHGQGLTLYGSPFDLHPPAAFGILSLVQGLQHPTDLVRAILELRPFVAVLGACIVGVVGALVFLTRRISAAIVTALLLALDPFEIRFDSRVMLEPFAQLPTALSILCLLVAQEKNGKARWALTLVAGLCAGWAFCTKETFGLVLLVFLLAALARPYFADRRSAATTLGVGAVCYVLSASLVIATAGFSAWWTARTSGLSRLIGTYQITGFNAPTTKVSLTSRIAANATTLASTYIILLLGVVVACAVMWRRKPWRGDALAEVTDRRVVALATWCLAATAYLCYATLFGSLEEQMYYIMLAPCAAMVSLLVTSPVAYLQRGKALARGALCIGAVALVGFQAGVWSHVHTTPDNNYRAFIDWQHSNIPPGSVVATTEYTAQFLMSDVKVGTWHDLTTLKEHHVDYVLLVTELVRQGYGEGTPEFMHYLETHSTKVFDVHGASEGHLELFDVRSLTGGSAMSAR